MLVTAPLFRPVQGPTPEPVDIVLIQPQGYPHAAVFDEVAETLQFGFRALGYECGIRSNNVRFGTPTIVLGAHLMKPVDARQLQTGMIIYNLEQIKPGAWARDSTYLALLARHVVWDFDSTNVDAIVAATGNREVHHVPIGYVPQLTRIPAAGIQDIDVLFYGSITPRRRAILESLTATGLNVSAVFGVYGAERDALIARAKVVLNLHAEDNWRFEIVRVSYLLSNRKAVVCEAGTPEEIDEDLRPGLRIASAESLVDACVSLVGDADGRRRLEQAGFEAFTRRSQAEILRRALTEPPPSKALMRTALSGDLYLDLLAKCLTNQIYGDPPSDFSLSSRIDPNLRGRPVFDAEQRSRGRDWPSQAMTMIGDLRLNNIRIIVEALLAANIPGDLIETGVWRGGACIFMRGILKAYDVRDRKVWVADSFSGLPPPDPKVPQDAGDIHHTYAELAVGIEDVKENFRKFGLLDEQVAFLPGWFSDTLAAAPIERLALLRLDGDMYASTMDALTALYHKVSPGGFVIVDDYGAVPACRQAVTDFREARGIKAQIVDIDGLGVFWQVPV